MKLHELKVHYEVTRRFGHIHGLQLARVLSKLSHFNSALLKEWKTRKTITISCYLQKPLLPGRLAKVRWIECLKCSLIFNAKRKIGFNFDKVAHNECYVRVFLYF